MALRVDGQSRRASFTAGLPVFMLILITILMGDQYNERKDVFMEDLDDMIFGEESSLPSDR